MPQFEQTKQMANQCIRCGICVKKCTYLKTFVGLPGNKAEEYLKGTYAQEAEVPYHCSLCGLCAQVCPVDLDTGAMMAEIRSNIIEEGIPLPGYVSLVAQNHAFTISDEYIMLKEAPSGTTERLFFPGCNLVTHSPQLVVEIYRYLVKHDPNCGILLGCCAAPHYDTGYRVVFDEVTDRIKETMDKIGAKELILACSNCLGHMTNYAHIPAVPLYEVLAQTWAQDGRRVEGLSNLVLHDPCKSRFFPELQASVRKLLEAAGCEYLEPANSGPKTRCCGQGGMVAYTDYQWTQDLGAQRAQEIQGTMVTYCATCRDTLRAWDTPGLHILDLLFLDNPQDIAEQPPQDQETTLANRALIHQLLQEV